MPEAWATNGSPTSLQGQGVKVGILDSGVAADNPAMTGRVASWKDYTPAASATPVDTLGHGTLVAQLLGGTRSPGRSSADETVDGLPIGSTYFEGGVAPQASLYFARTTYPSDNLNHTDAIFSALTDLSAQGVRLYNLSYGQGDITDGSIGVFNPDNTASLASAEYRIYKPAIDADSLLVFAAGNEGQANPSQESGLPYAVPGIEHNWLAVVNVALDASGNVVGLSKINGSPSNACGVAADWCLAAPGLTAVMPVTGTMFPTGLSNGTSGATPIVTGTAALVWQQFPWMTAANVQETLLGTATPLGDPSLYGYGMVNAAAAVKGPGRFDWGSFDVNVPAGMVSTFANDITGTGSLNLEGDGQINLTGNSTYTGGTTVTSGTLNLTGSVAGDVTVKAGALAGYGKVAGSVTNTATGAVASYGYPGKGLSIGGDYTASVTTTTAIGLGSPLAVGGKASLDGTLEILAPDSKYTVGGAETLLTAGSLTGTFAKQTYGSGVFYSVGGLTYGATSLTALIVRQPTAQSVALTPATASVAVGLDKALDQADQWAGTSAGYGAHDAFLTSAAKLLSAPSQAAAVASITSLNGEIYATSNAIEAQQSQVTDDAIAAHQLAAFGSDHPGVWVQALGADGGLSQAGFAGARYTLGGAMIGLDTPIAGNVDGGVALGRTSINANLAGLAGRTNGRANSASVYATARWDNGTYLSGRVSWARNKMDVSRTALLGDTAPTISGNRSDDVTRATLEVGKALTAGQASITPYVAVTGLRLVTDGFTESGAGGLGLAVRSQYDTAVFGTLGARFSRGFDWAGGHSILTGYLAWRHTLSALRLGTDATFAGAPSSDFTIAGQGLARNTAQAGVNLATKINDQWSWYVNADAQAARYRSHDVSVNAGLEFRF